MSDKSPSSRPRILRVGAVAEATGLSRSQIYRLAEEDTDFPRPVRLTQRTLGWSAEAIDAWINARLAAAS